MPEKNDKEDYANRLGETTSAEFKGVASELTTEKLLNYLRYALARKIRLGDIHGAASELEDVIKLENAAFNNEPGARAKLEEKLNQIVAGIPEENKVPRKKTMTDKAIAANRRNAKKSTGPTTPEGKAASAANGTYANFKHGRHAKRALPRLLGVCRETCTDYPCTAVEDGSTKANDLCLRHEDLAEKIKVIVHAANGGGMADMKELSAITLAKAMHSLDEMLGRLHEDGTLLREAMFNKHGEQIGWTYKNHPHLKAIMDMIFKLGLTASDQMLTEKEQKRGKNDEENRENLAKLAADAGKLAAAAFGNPPQGNDGTGK